jgi:hypothetical protein
VSRGLLPPRKAEGNWAVTHCCRRGACMQSCMARGADGIRRILGPKG